MTATGSNLQAGVAPTAANSTAECVALHLGRFLQLGAAQLQVAVKESDQRVAMLSSAVAAAATDARALENCARRLAESDGASVTELREQLALLADRFAQQSADMVNALQFYDKLVQRLTHVREGLALPAKRLANAADLPNVDWNALLESVRDCYSMAEERVMFDLMVRGLGPAQIVSGLTNLRAAANPGELELF